MYESGADAIILDTVGAAGDADVLAGLIATRKLTEKYPGIMVEICRLDGLQVGVGDPLGMNVTHAIASGMGGMRAAGDLVARMQNARGMKLAEAKKNVADKLQVSIPDLTDPIIMNEVREDLKLGLLHPRGGSPKCMEAKFDTAELLGIDINCVQRFKKNASI